MQNIELKSEKGRRFQNRRWPLFALAAFLSAASCASGDPGYLPHGGPLGFRFLAVAKPAPAFVSPAAPVPSPEPAPVLGPPAPQPVPDPVSPAVIETTVPAPATNQVPVMPIEQTRPEDVVSPQMLLKFFNKGTNGAATSVTVPLDFTPPRPAEPSNSKASYSTGP